MIALIQRVSRASVVVDNQTIGAIDKGLLVLLGVEREDNREKMEKLATKVMSYRVFSDENGKMNLNLT
ncbi:MAG: D-aminoacyl-tRNA deacylase, partial [Shewanella sp.]